MRTLDDISYSRQATINAVRDFYTFLVQLHLPASYIHEPPEGGWPHITSERARIWGKDDTVMELLRHLPYLYDGDNVGGDHAQCAPYTGFEPFNFQRSNDTEYDMRIMTEGPIGLHFGCEIPPHVIGLVSGEHHGPRILLDTKLGVIHWLESGYPEQWGDSFPECVRYDTEEHAVSETDAHWRQDSCAWAVQDFFEVWKQMFRTLEWFPWGDGTVSAMNASSNAREDPEQQAKYHKVAETMRSFGWPDLSRYRKDECMEAMTHLERP